MTDVPATRFESTATKQGGQDIVQHLGAFVGAHGVGPIERGQIANTLTAFLGLAAGHASSLRDARLAVVADVMPEDVQLVIRLLLGDGSAEAAGGGHVGGLELWISFPRQRPLVSNRSAPDSRDGA